MVEYIFTVFVEDEIHNCFYIKKEGFCPGSIEAHNAKVDYKKFLLSLTNKIKEHLRFIIIGSEEEMNELESMKFFKEQLRLTKVYPNEYKKVIVTK